MADVVGDDDGSIDISGIDEIAAHLNDAFKSAAKQCLPESAARTNRPWVRAPTLALIDRRTQARKDSLHILEQDLTKQIRLSIKRDRSTWIDELVASGEWTNVRKLRKGFVPKQGRLKDADGVFVSTDQRAETLAQYLENVQWAVRPTVLALERPCLGCTLPVYLGDITQDEVIRAGRRLNSSRAPGPDEVPPEFWKAIARPSSPALRWALEFCRQCWRHKKVPEDWRYARVAAIFKKGDVADCPNYRPISLLQIGYKMFASILLDRLKKGGAENRLWPTQYGFRSKCGTADALFLARRAIEQAWEDKTWESSIACSRLGESI